MTIAERIPEIVNKDWNHFNEVDPFNPNNTVEGYISIHSGNDYGALCITKVNGHECIQLIYCTPKIRYPFDATDHWHFPKAQRIERYEKLDGTNVFVYSYQDAKGNKFCAAKTRLKPFLGNSKFGPFFDLWKEATKDYWNNLRLSVLNSKYNYSFELWGAQNSHLVKYDTPMQASLLFARKGTVLVPPSEIETIASGVEQAPFAGLVDGNYVQDYQATQEKIDSELKEVDDGFIGQEGEVWYLLDEQGDWNLFKCKPHQIEQIHWAAGGIGKNIIIATCQNAHENWDEPTVENVVQLLEEEFNKYEVEKVLPGIRKYLSEVRATYILRAAVIQKYVESGENFKADIGRTMNVMDKFFNKNEMSRVFTFIKAYVGE